jgi:Putative metallopeptidase
MLRNWCATLATGCAIVAITSGIAAAESRPNRIDINYQPASESPLQPIATYVKQAHALEKVQALLKPVKLPRRLLIQMRGCQGESNAWYEDNVMTICYEFLDDIWKNVPAETTAAGVAPVDAMVGPFVDVVLHEFGHAIFEMLKVPVFGREEDAADQISVFLTLKFPKDEARRLILGNAYQYKSDLEGHKLPLSLEHFADEHGAPAQRFFNVLCWAYGSDTKLFADVVAKGYLPAARAEACEDEYQQMSFAFDTLIRPHIDRKLAKQLYGSAWLPPVTTRPPPRKVPH